MVEGIKLDPEAQAKLLAEVVPAFTGEDNTMLLKVPDKEEIIKVLKKSNLHAAPGTTG